ncbi:hypothetical protein FRACYDRAFT_253488 [Fragilariopsis cylindrus CCMP1102]|uniref:Uncharacterized protein n=1 Tax=Fragilariopsis cylindrus CCMP1102 TaxID=635003 RepID=A0A1E7ELI1_9STRA|nr:hypothetical protein FRACYDRAFT_253488 [Fragilariopsis cylindrus CCMP1102]|eukprot:OEU06735.1 hypothetical protein FRACYDRAFT_253488 [Fragilariopsis cylindrus CCMP1102]
MVLHLPNLGDMYEQGIYGVGVDLAKSRGFFELSISQGEIVAIHNFAISLTMRGEHAEAKTKFIEAAARGFEGSIDCLRMMEEERTGVSNIEIQAAARLCQRAKDLNQNDINNNNNNDDNDNDNNIMATREDDPLIFAVYAKSADVDVITERNPSVKKSF